jgi:hypothetical protein
MNFLKSFVLLLGLSTVPSCNATPQQAPAVEHAVIVNFTYGSTNLQPMFDLEEKLDNAITKAKVGEYDGNEIAVDGSDGILYMYGPDADRLFEIIKPILESASFMRGAKVTLRYGPPEDGVPEKVVAIDL